MHRDIKPENIVFLKKNELYDLKVIDFGLATFTDVEKLNNFNKIFRYIFTKCGTPGYVAPEILSVKSKNQKYTPLCDIFSIGVIFHKL